MWIQLFFLVLLFLIIIIIFNYKIIRYQLMVYFTDFKLFLKKNDTKLVLHLNKLHLRINELLDLLNKNELVQQIIYTNRLSPRFIYLLNISLKVLDRLILLFLKKK